MLSIGFKIREDAGWVKSCLEKPWSSIGKLDWLENGSERIFLERRNLIQNSSRNVFLDSNSNLIDLIFLWVPKVIKSLPVGKHLIWNMPGAPKVKTNAILCIYILMLYPMSHTRVTILWMNVDESDLKPFSIHFQLFYKNSYRITSVYYKKLTDLKT